MLRFLIHRLAHLIGVNRGEFETWHEPHPRGGERLMVAFRCHQCGEMSKPYPAPPWPDRVPWSEH